MVQSEAFRDPGSISGGSEQPPEISPGAASDRMAGCHKDDHHRSRNVCRDLRKHPEPVHQLHHRRSRQDQADLYATGNTHAGPSKGSHSQFDSRDHKQHESQYRSVPGRRHHRRIPGRKKRTWVSDHLFQSGI